MGHIDPFVPVKSSPVNRDSNVLQMYFMYFGERKLESMTADSYLSSGVIWHEADAFRRLLR